MSWRTQGHYRGLGEADAAWLRDFDRKWDTRDAGRSRTDALDHAAGFEAKTEGIQPKKPRLRPAERPELPVAESITRIELEATLIRAAGDIARFTVPRQTKAGWSIHLVMSCGKRVRAHFEDLSAATQAYEAIEEFLLWFHRG